MIKVWLILIFILTSQCSVYESQDRAQFEEDYKTGQIQVGNNEVAALTCWKQSTEDILASQLTANYRVEVNSINDQNIEVCLYEK